MKSIILLILTFISFFLHAQNIEIEGSAKIRVMEPSSNTAQNVMRGADGTLSSASNNGFQGRSRSSFEARVRAIRAF